jgi:hypothetical protein
MRIKRRRVNDDALEREKETHTVLDVWLDKFLCVRMTDTSMNFYFYGISALRAMGYGGHHVF